MSNRRTPHDFVATPMNRGVAHRRIATLRPYRDAVQRYTTASDGWRFAASRRRTDARSARNRPDELVREPDGVRHAVDDHGGGTLCGRPVAGLTLFPDVGFRSARAADRCVECAARADASRRTSTADD
jgi:hypothetical protein